MSSILKADESELLRREIEFFFQVGPRVDAAPRETCVLRDNAADDASDVTHERLSFFCASRIGLHVHIREPNSRSPLRRACGQMTSVKEFKRVTILASQDIVDTRPGTV